MQQNRNASDIFTKFLEKEKFANIIEIGTRYGGFTRFIKDISPNSNVYTYDIFDQKPFFLDKHGIEVRIKNIFSDDYIQILDQEVLGVLKSDSKNLVLCDGGNKIKEFNCLANYIKVGDIIMAHDYSPSIEYFNDNINGKIWNWCEITEADISDISTKCNLEPYNQEEMQNAVWVCKMKMA